MPQWLKILFRILTLGISYALESKCPITSRKVRKAKCKDCTLKTQCTCSPFFLKGGKKTVDERDVLVE